VVDGGDPGATDYRIHLAEFDHATTKEPQLIVTYSETSEFFTKAVTVTFVP
jgi:hypothetical protein